MVSSVTISFGVSLTLLMWTTGWWCVGHVIYLGIKGCKDSSGICYFSNHSGSDIIGFLFAFGASMAYFFIAHKVVNALYGGQLPDGSPIGNMEKIMRSYMNSQQPSRSERRKNK